MVAPASIKNTDGQSMDTSYASDGTGRAKMAVGSKSVGLTKDVAWQGAATHEDGAAFAASDGINVIAGVDAGDGTTIRKAAVDSAGRLEVALTPATGNLTDRSGTITVAATSQELAAVNVGRKYLRVQNLDGAEDLWINFTDDAAVDTEGSICLPALGSFVMEGSFISSEKVTVIATTVDHKFTAKEA